MRLSCKLKMCFWTLIYDYQPLERTRCYDEVKPVFHPRMGMRIKRYCVPTCEDCGRQKDDYFDYTYKWGPYLTGDSSA